MNKCEFCGKEHNGTYGTGRFCNSTCARKYSNKFVSENGRKNQIDSLNKNRGKKSFNDNTKYNENKTTKQKYRKNKTIKSKYRKDLLPKYNHTSDLGKIGELEVSKKFIQHGYKVFVPLVDSSGIDLVVHNKNGFKTVQVKSSTNSKIRENSECESTTFKVCKTDRHINKGTYTQTEMKYSTDEIDYIALYSAYNDESYLFKNADHLPINITVRNINSKSNQIKKINYAKDYQIDKVLDDINLTRGIIYDDENIIDVNYSEIK